MNRLFDSGLRGVVVLAGIAFANGNALAQEPDAASLRELDAGVIVRGTVRQSPLASMLGRDVVARLRAASQSDRQSWAEIKTREAWERWRDARLQALRASLGDFPPPPLDLTVRVTRRLEGDSYRVDNIVFQSRPGVVVTANLYRPTHAGAKMAGILLCHSHQSTKNTSWRQDMAMTWARAGCVVLVPDHLGHGERRQHPFGDGQHDYHFRFDAGIQLHLVGESLMGWLAYDLMRGVDLLLAQKDVDANRILLISEPAGGGDVAAVTAALDPRITAVMVQNFGGPEPEDAYPLSRDVEETFAYAGSGSWESTRNLRLSARDGFLPWMIVASIAPRRLIYFHEFYWDREHDPVWRRLRKVWGFYNADDALVGMGGRGFVVGSAPENTHWLPINRELLYPVLERWFAIPNPKHEFSKRRPEEDLLCMTPEVASQLKPQPLHRLAAQLGGERSRRAREGREKLSPPERRERLQRDWRKLLGDVAPLAKPLVWDWPDEPQRLGGVAVERIHLCTEPGIAAPVLLLLPSSPKGVRLPVVIAMAQQGKQEFLRQRAEPIAELLAAGFAVCLPDVRGTGETSPGSERDRRSPATSISSSELMLGQTLLAGQLRDLRSVIRYLQTRPELNLSRLAFWGDSFAAINPSDVDHKVPYTGPRPPISEPLGGLLAMLGALFEDSVQAVYVRHGLSDYASLFEDGFVYAPHDAVVPGVLTIGDLGDMAAALAPRALRLDDLVDGHNRLVPEAEALRRYEVARDAYAGARHADRLQFGQAGAGLARWLIGSLR